MPIARKHESTITMPKLLHIALSYALLTGVAFGQVPQEASPCSIDRAKGVAEGRLQLPSLAHQLKLAEANEVPVLLQGYKVHSANAVLRNYNSHGGLESPDDSVEVAVKYHPDGGAYITIVPEKLGKIQLSIAACFADGTLSNAWGDAEVILPDRKPDSLYVISNQSSDDRPSGTIYMGLVRGPKKERLFPKALYQGAHHLVPIPPSLVSFELITAKGAEPPISIDVSSGTITPLHRGHALIKSTFEGFSVLTCVDVMEDASDGSDRTVCKELVPEGMTSPLSGFEDDGQQPRVKAQRNPH